MESGNQAEHKGFFLRNSRQSHYGRGRSASSLQSGEGTWYCLCRRQCLCHARATAAHGLWRGRGGRSEEHTSELQSLMRISYAVFCLKTNIAQDETNRNNYCPMT